MKDKQIIAVMSGGDWNDAGVKHIILLKDVDLENEKKKKEEWYENEYLPKYRKAESKQGKYPEYYTFPEWLIKEGLARECTEDELLKFWDY